MTGVRQLAGVLVCVFLCSAVPAAADEVLDWNAIAVGTIPGPPAVPGPLQSRLLAIMHVAMFDAVNGIERRFTQITHSDYLDAEAPRGASRRAAAVWAAYTALAALRPGQAAALAEKRDASLAAIVSDEGLEDSESIQRGRDWGEQVARAVLLWRSGDAPAAPPFLGSMTPGKWRPTPPAFAPGLAPTLGAGPTFVIPSPSHFRPAGPPDLTSPEYAAEVNEVKRVGALNVASADDRNSDETFSAQFWAGAAASVWNRAAVDAARGRNTTLSQNARLFALLNVAQADALIAAWESKYLPAFLLWRPITAIREADTDSNPATIADPAWTPLIVTPPYPEYYSGHQSVSGTSYAVLTAFFGNETPVEAYSEVFGPTRVLTWPNFKAAADDALEARIFAGIHFRFAMNDTRTCAEQIAAYVLEKAAQPLNGEKTGQLAK